MLYQFGSGNCKDQADDGGKKLPINIPKNGLTPHFVARMADVYAPIAKNAACPMDICPLNPNKRSRPVVPML